jgi:hypothetical protein
MTALWAIKVASTLTEKKKMFDAHWRLQIDMAHDHEAPKSVTFTLFLLECMVA